MKISKNKTMASLIALSLILTIAASLVSLATVNAQTINRIYSMVYVAVSPSVVGVNQEVLLVQWTAAIPPDIGEQTGLIAGGRAAWYDLKFNVTTPGNATEILTIAQSDPVGGGYIAYTPTQIGTYYVQAIFPEVWKNTTATRSFYTAAVSPKVSFTVQQEPVPTQW